MVRRMRSMLDDELDGAIDDLSSVSPLANVLDQATAPQGTSGELTPAERQLAEYQASRRNRDLPVYGAGQQSHETETRR